MIEELFSSRSYCRLTLVLGPKRGAGPSCNQEYVPAGSHGGTNHTTGASNYTPKPFSDEEFYGLQGYYGSMLQQFSADRSSGTVDMLKKKKVTRRCCSFPRSCGRSFLPALLLLPPPPTKILYFFASIGCPPPLLHSTLTGFQAYTLRLRHPHSDRGNF